MTREEKKKILRGYNDILYSIDILTDEYTKAFTSATKITSASDGMPHATSNESKMEKNGAKLVEVRKKLERQIEKKLVIDRAIERLNPKQQRIIKKCDIGGMSLHRYSIEVKRTYRNIILLHNNALDKLTL